MAWIKSHQGLLTHRKTLMACEKLGVSPFVFVGHLHALWYWALDNATDTGLLPNLSHAALGVIAGWQRKPARFIEVLIDVNFIDMDGTCLSLHDWPDYTGKLNERRATERQRLANKRATLHQQTTNVGATLVNLEREEEKELEKDSLSSEREAARASLGWTDKHDDEGFIQQYRLHYEQSTGTPIDGRRTLAAGRIEKKYGFEACMRVATALGWEKPPNYYVGALEDDAKGIPDHATNRVGTNANGASQTRGASAVSAFDLYGGGWAPEYLPPESGGPGEGAPSLDRHEDTAGVEAR